MNEPQFSPEYLEMVDRMDSGDPPESPCLSKADDRLGATALFGLAPGPPAPPMPPPPTDAPGTMLIRFERTPRCLWHPSCTESRNAIVREIEVTTAYGVVECTACCRRAKLPVGSGVETRCEEIPLPNAGVLAQPGEISTNTNDAQS